MSGELCPLGDRAGAGARPELLASDEDRERVAEILRVPPGDGRLTAAELDERLEVALSARIASGLAALTIDLPAVADQPGVAAPQPKDLVRIDWQGAAARRDGGWVVPRRMEIRALGGSVRIRPETRLASPVVLRVEVSGEAEGGSIVAGPPRRTCWQWLLRKRQHHR